MAHFYSPLNDIEFIKANSERIFKNQNEFPGIDLNVEAQMELLNRFIIYYEQCPFPENKTNDMRYFFNNDFYSYSDSIMLFCMMRELKPRQIIEVGSGFSSAVMLDTNERYFSNKLRLSFVEPYAERLRSILKPEDSKSELINIIEQKVQDVDLSEFRKLQKNDILFIDSSHVSKVDSDVNHILFDILPVLESGVYIHFHDIFQNFQYPKEWVYKGVAWNECYLIRAFLQYNHKFEIALMNTYMEKFYRDFFEKNMPNCLKNEGGSLWLRKL